MNNNKKNGWKTIWETFWSNGRKKIKSEKNGNYYLITSWKLNGEFRYREFGRESSIINRLVMRYGEIWFEQYKNSRCIFEILVDCKYLPSNFGRKK